MIIFPNQFHPRLYATLADRRGWTVLWRRAQRCPCLRDDRQPDPDCAVCDGLGFSLAPGLETKLTVAGNSRRRDYLQAGTTEEGDLRFSIPAFLWNRVTVPYHLAENPAYDASEGDIIVALRAGGSEITATQSVVLERGRRDRLRSHHPIKVIRVEALRGSGKTAQTIALVQGQDFRIDADGRTFVWASAAEPAIGENYSVLYSFRPEYVLRTNIAGHHANPYTRLNKIFTARVRDRVEG